VPEWNGKAEKVKEVSMEFDIYSLDNLEPGSAQADKKLDGYLDALLRRFNDSPEGRTLRQAHPQAGFWTEQLLYYGFNYQGAALPRLTVADVEEIVTELMPRKVSLRSPEEAEAAIPELLAFWEYLKREYRLPAAEAVLRLLRDIQPRFKGLMNDPKKFGMAKSLLMMGQSAGFDMTDQEQANAFIALYNASLAAKVAGEEENPPNLAAWPPHPSGSHRRQAKSRRKNAKASRKKGRKKR
jgi:hypothetical protein